MTLTPIAAGHGIATVKYLRGGAGSEDVVTFGYRSDGTQSADLDASDLATQWIAAFTAASTLNSYTFTGVHVLRNNGGIYESGDAVHSDVGTVSAPAASPAIAVRVTKKTDRAGVRYRGRMFLPPAFVSESNVDASGVIDAATITSVQGKCNAFLAALNGAAAPHPDRMVLLHPDLLSASTVTALKVRTSVGTQRRRQALL